MKVRDVIVMVCMMISIKFEAKNMIIMSLFGRKTAKIVVLISDLTSASAYITCSLTYRPSYDTRTSIDYQC